MYISVSLCGPHITSARRSARRNEEPRWRHSEKSAKKMEERVTGIEPAWPAWKAGALPLSYTRGVPPNTTWIAYPVRDRPTHALTEPNGAIGRSPIAAIPGRQSQPKKSDSCLGASCWSWI